MSDELLNRTCNNNKSKNKLQAISEEYKEAINHITQAAIMLNELDSKCFKNTIEESSKIIGDLTICTTILDRIKT